MAFTYEQALPGVYHIADAMGVCMTLLAGEERALLVDTGYGVEDVAAFVRTLTDKPLTVLLTHGHYDHALGARWFDNARLFPADLPVYETYAGEYWRRHVLEGVHQHGLKINEADFLAAALPAAQVQAEEAIDLGGMTARILLCPGHTPGSAVVYVPERELLLTGDDWNPTVWLFYPEALPVRQYRENVKKLLDLPFRHVLCSHQPRLFRRGKLEAFLAGLTDEALDAAGTVPTGELVHVRTAQAALPDEQYIVFDRDKYQQEKESTL